MTAARRPPRIRKTDRLLSPDASALEMRCDMALAPFDRANTEMEGKWGIDRLPGLVSVTTAERYGSAVAKMYAALDAANPDETSARVAVCIRGLAAMDAEAVAAGHQPKSPDVWEAEYNGRVFSVIQDARDSVLVKVAEGRRVYTMREVAIALDAIDRGVFAHIKNDIPEARVVAIRNAPPAEGFADECIPF